MVRGANKSGARKKIFVRTPTGTKERYEEKRASKPQCGNCGRILLGVAAGRKNEIAKLSKTQKRPSRPYGGHLCAPCTRQLLRAQARLSSE